MKKLLYILAMSVLAAGLAACTQEKVQPAGDVVDLRYRVESEYNLDATSPKPFTIVVKSTKPWTITSSHPEWCIISEEEGDAQPDSLVHVGKGENTTVRVQYYDNTELDARVDYIEIASDGWVAKKVTINQKGIAFLRVPDEEQAFDVPKAGGNVVFNIISNQDWSAKITEMEGSWLSISEGATGTLNGTVTLTATENSGWKRYAAVSVYDRHGEERAIVKITQDGVQLDPKTEELHVNFDQLSTSVEVVANTKWTAEKDTGDDWYTIDNPTGHDGNGTLNITVTSNAEGTAIRKGTITFKTVPANEGDASAQKEIVIKQAYPLASVRVEMNMDEINNWGGLTGDKGQPLEFIAGEGALFSMGPLGYSRLNMSKPAGSYSFHWKSFSSDVRVRHWFCYSDGQEVKFDLKADGSTSSSFNNGSSAKPENYGSGLSGIDMTKDHLMSYIFSQEGDYCHVSMQVDGNEAYAFSSSPAVMNMVLWGKSINMYIGVETGSAILDWYEYTPPFSWDEE